MNNDQKSYKLSNQALGAVMMALQESLLNELDIVPILKSFELVATDDDQIFFKFQSDATNSEAFTTFANWHLVHSIGGTDYILSLIHI